MLRVEIGSCLEESVATRSVGPQSNPIECPAICKKEKKKRVLAREAGQPGQLGKGEVLLAPSGLLCKVWLLDRLPGPDTPMLLSFISNSLILIHTLEKLLIFCPPGEIIYRKKIQ